MRDIPEDARYFFSIRNPISRFYSGFYSRKRKGQPRRNAEWTIFDEFAFDEFEEANDLAEALFSGGVMERKAVAAIKSIRHTAQNQFDWFYCCGSFLDVRPPVYIIRQENFDEDFQAFMIHANLEKYLDKVEIARDGVASHANDYSKTPPLSEKARQNLEIWYAQDMAFHRMCVDWIEARKAQASGLERAAS